MKDYVLLIQSYICIVSLKLLLVPSYHSTDFEVHRNWLAITYRLPINEWYHANHSEWTLDYPPLFAWMEKIIAYPAILFDPQMLDVKSTNYDSWMTRIFLRSSVIVTDFVLFYSLLKFLHYNKGQDSKDPIKEQYIFFKEVFLIFSILANFGLFVIDHIHFQYNGILFGILFLSILSLLEHKIMESAFWFSILLCMKHIFLYISPVFAVYMLKQCSIMPGQFSFTKFFTRLLCIGTIVILVFSISFGPFILLGQFQQILSRLFPFKRGLCHAYWAPNFWPIYNVADKVLVTIGKKLNLINVLNVASMTGGLVQNFEHCILPIVLPLHTFLLVLVSMLPALCDLWLNALTKSHLLVEAIVTCSLSSFMFGWHVHEKAILIAILPYTLIALDSNHHSRLYFILISVGYYSLFPLIFTPQETLIKYALYVFTMVFTYLSMDLLHQTKNNKTKSGILFKSEIIVFIPIILIEFYNQLIHIHLFPSFPFLPLLLTSLYSSIVISYVWLQLQMNHLSHIYFHFKRGFKIKKI